MRCSLNRFVACEQLLPSLGMLKPPLLPATLRCPNCKTPTGFFIYRDHVYGGEWSHCRKCSFRGDMIELAAVAWKLDAASAVVKLGRRGLLGRELSSGEIDDYIRDHVDRRRKIDAFCKESRAVFLTAGTPGLRDLQRILCVESLSDWDARGGSLFGASTRIRFEEVFGDSMFPGKGWVDVLVVPFHDLPGRVSGCLAIGRALNGPADTVFRKVLHGPPQTAYDAGLGMFATSFAERRYPALDGARFVVLDPLVAIRLQLRHLRQAPTPLPILLGIAEETYGTGSSLATIPAQKTVFWGPDRLSSLAAARTHRGLVSWSLVDGAGLHENLYDRQPLEWLTRMLNVATPWQPALRTLLQKATPAGAESILQRLGMTAVETDAALADCDAKTQASLGCLLTANRPRSCKVNSKVVFERDGGWHTQKETIANGMIRIDQVLANGSKGSLYKGRILFEGKEFPFLERTGRLERGALSWASRFLRDKARAGILQWAPGWDKHGAALALGFHTPAFVDSIERMGWHPSGRFDLPLFSIGRQGEVVSDAVRSIPLAKCPAVDLPPPTDFTAAEMESLSRPCEEARIVWAVAAAVLNRITGPARHVLPAGTLLVGEGAQRVGQEAAKLLGCRELLQLHRRLDQTAATIRFARGDHDWPLQVTRRTRYHQSTSWEWLDDPATADAIIPVPYVTALTLGIRGTWNMIVENRSLGGLHLTKTAVPKIVTNFLQHLMRNNLEMPLEEDSFLSTASALEDWFAGLGGLESLRRYRIDKVLRTPTTQPPLLCFVRLVTHLCNSGKLRLADDIITPAHRADLIPDGDKFWVGQEALTKVCFVSGGLKPDTLLITKKLEDAGVLLDEERRHGRRGWTIKHSWWNTMLRE